VMEGADLAIRLGRLTDSSFGARRLATAPRLLVAAPSYLAARGTPATLTDLAGHDCIFGVGGSAREGWVFRRGDTAVAADVHARIQVSSGEGVIACVKAGLGIAIASGWMCRKELASGAVVPLLTDHRLEPVDVHAVFPGGPRPSSKVRALVDHLAATLHCVPLSRPVHEPEIERPG
jgi:DNA-binding transcriptional LysR family regulator